MSPLFVGSGRAVVAALLAAGALAVTRQRLPRGVEWGRLLIVAGGVVIGFPLLTTYALTTTSAAHSAVVIALLPAATAVVSDRGHGIALKLHSVGAFAWVDVQRAQPERRRCPPDRAGGPLRRKADVRSVRREVG